MEEKRYEIRSSIRAISSHRNLRKFFPFRSNYASNYGFSLIELLVVIAVIGILAAGVLAVIDPIAQMQKGADGRRKSDLKQIQTGLELYRSDCGRYPAASSNSVPTTLTSSSPTVSGPCPSIGVTYMQRVPQDPKYGRYVYSPTGGGYTLSACAEKPSPSDPDVVNSNVVTGCTSGKNFRYYSP